MRNWTGFDYPEDFLAEFRRVEPPRPNDECWMWSRSVGKHGYGIFCALGRASASHRTSYAAYVAQPPKGLVVRHKCDNRWCWNPRCLLIGTDADNARDAAERDRMAYGEARALKLTSGDARSIFAAYHAGVTVSALMVQYGVDSHTVWSISRRTLWRRATADLQSGSLTRNDRMLRGTKNPAAKFSDEVIAAIRERVAAGERQIDLSRELGVSRTHVSQIVRRVSR